jgi:FkbM family methyltransferase
MSAPPALFSLKDVLGSACPTVDVLDVGARIEGRERYASLVEAGMARVAAVEPNTTEVERLRAARPDIARFIPRFLGDGGQATVHITAWPGCISIYEPDPNVIGLFSGISVEPRGNFHVIRTERVQTVRLDDIDPPVAPDYIKLDVQGAELTVLRHGTASIAKTAVIECEVEFIPVYKGQPLFDEVQRFLRDRGFALHKLIDLGSRCFRPISLGHPAAGLSQILWADAVFVRDFADLDAYGDDMLLRAALVLHDVYASVDLVHFLLLEYDRRCASDFAVRYNARLKTVPELPRQIANLKETD